jgi:hypothetical protein
MLLPLVRGRISRGATVVGCTLFSCTGVALLGLSHHWLPAAFGMLLFGVGWTSAYATIQAAAQLVCPPWVRARALSIYQLAQNGALTAASFLWGWLGGEIGLADTLLVAASSGILIGALVRGFSIDTAAAKTTVAPTEPLPVPEAPDAALIPTLRRARGRVMETVHYRVEQSQRPAFLAAMAEVRRVRGRAGANFWQLYEDVAHPEGWLEMWSVESWTDHLREVIRLSEEDRAVLSRAGVFQCGGDGPRPARYIAVHPQDMRPDEAAGQLARVRRRQP